MKSIILIFCIVFALGDCKLPMPKSMKACSRSDPNLNQCFEKSANQALQFLARSNGLPEYHMESLRPLSWRDGIEIDIPPMRMFLTKTSVSGLANATISNPHIDLNNRRIQYEYSSPEIIWRQSFEADINVGNHTDRIRGHDTIAFRNSSWNVSMGYEMQEINGTQYANVTDPYVKCIHSDVDFDFGGADRDPSHQDHFEHFKGNFLSEPLERACGRKVAEFYNDIFNNVPFNEVFTP